MSARELATVADIPSTRRGHVVPVEALIAAAERAGSVHPVGNIAGVRYFYRDELEAVVEAHLATVDTRWRRDAVRATSRQRRRSGTGRR